MSSRPTPPRPQPLAPRREGLYDPSFESDACRGGATPDAQAFDRALYVIRRRCERWAIEESTQGDQQWFAIPSCSARTIVYKGMLKPDQLAEYFPDLTDPDIESALALVHSRYS